jgi:hypothetical protein
LIEINDLSRFFDSGPGANGSMDLCESSIVLARAAVSKEFSFLRVYTTTAYA